MATSYTSAGKMSFPFQKRRRSQKTESYYKECVDAADTIVGFDVDNGLRASMAEKLSNVNLINNIVDPAEVSAVINPYKIEAKFDNTYKNYPLLNSYMAVLLGEEREARFNPLITMSNPDLVNTKLEEITALINKSILEKVVSGKFSEEETAQAIQGQAKWMKFNYRDRRELMASQLIYYGYSSQNMKELFSKCFEDLLVSGEEIAVCEIAGGEPIIRKGNPLNIFTIRSGNTYRIEDSDLIIELGYVPIGQIIDEYHEELKDSQIKKLEDGYAYNNSASGRLFNRSLINVPIDLTSWINQQGGIGAVVSASTRAASFFGGSFDAYGNVRKLRVLWKGMKKVGILKFYDEEGDIQKTYVDEDYPLNDIEAENVEWIWLGEWNEATKLGDDIYVKMGPRPVQFRSMDNPSKCNPGIVGNIFNTNDSKSLSFVSLGKSYQLMYNFFMHKLWEELKTYKGKVARISTSMIPSQFTMDQFLFYIDQMKIVFEDEFNEGKKGAALGKLAGTMNRGSGSIEIGDPGVIESLLGILTFLENRIQDIVGITPQRKGAIQSRETVGGVERSVKQSSLNTAKYFSIHDDFVNRAIEAYIETAKIAWKDQKFKRQFILSDGSQTILDFDSQQFTESEYGIYSTNSAVDKDMMNTLKSLVQPFMQNQGTLSMVIELYRTQDPAALQRKFEAFEEQIQQQIAKQQEAVLAQKEAEVAREEALKRYDIDKRSETAIEVALINQEGRQTTETETEPEDNSDEMALKRDALEEEKRGNRRKEGQKDRELEIKRKVANRPVTTKK
uniref:Putative structural protein n=1 Tax=viral metagenome TaxID=1070528 RepID=A0A6M3JZQ4_9ZZZZ